MDPASLLWGAAAHEDLGIQACRSVPAHAVVAGWKAAGGVTSGEGSFLVACSEAATEA
jgi:hypothetical protein